MGKKVGSVRKRVLYEEQCLDEIHKNFSAKKPRPVLPPTPSMAPADFAGWRDGLAEFIQARFSPHMGGMIVTCIPTSLVLISLCAGVVRDLTVLSRDDVAAFFLRNLKPAMRKDPLKRRSRFPAGQFQCIKFKISSARDVLELFEGSAVEFVIRKYYASTSATDDTLTQLDGPLPPLTLHQMGELVRSNSTPRHTHSIHWLVCDVLKKAYMQQCLVIDWWPSLLPQSHTGELCFKFSYEHVTDGARVQGEHRRPLAPTVTDPLACAAWRTTAVDEPTNDKPFRLHLVKIA